MASADEHRTRIADFYAAFGRGDGDAMAAHYAPDATFRDPAFGELTGEEAGDMWHMLTSRATDLEIELPEHDADAAGGTAHWIARYTFHQTGRHVVNDIRARFRFAPDGRFAEHVDDFSFHAWSKQALGTPGTLLGWTPVLPALTRKRARAQLAAYRDRSGADGDAVS
jgi:ketosteroid isomerase-like protein